MRRCSWLTYECITSTQGAAFKVKYCDWMRRHRQKNQKSEPEQRPVMIRRLTEGAWIALCHQSQRESYCSVPVSILIGATNTPHA